MKFILLQLLPLYPINLKNIIEPKFFTPQEEPLKKTP